MLSLLTVDFARDHVSRLLALPDPVVVEKVKGAAETRAKTVSDLLYLGRGQDGVW